MTERDFASRIRGDARRRKKLERPSRLADVAADRIRSLVLEGQLSPGQTLRQEQLAEQLGVSRTPLRQALQQLESEGLIVYSPAGTASVVELTNAEAGELLDLRDMVDGFAARRVARLGLPREVSSRLETLMDEMDEAMQESDKPKYLIANAEFHLAILKATEHNLLNQFASLIQLSSHAAFLEGADYTKRLKDSQQEHRQIIEAIKSGHQDEAEHAARQHIRNAFGAWYSSSQS